MIRKIQIKNFRKIKKMEFDNLSRINIIAGKNSSGKTTALEAVFTNLGRLTPDVFMRILAFRGAEEFEVDTETIIKPLFNDYDLSKTIEIKLFDEVSVRDLKIKYNEHGNAPAIPQNIPFNLGMMTSELSDGSIQGEMLEYDFNFNGKNYKHKLIFGNGQYIFNNGNNDNEKMIAGFISTRVNSINSETSKFYNKLKIKKEHLNILEAVKIIEPNVIDIITAGNNVLFDIGKESYKPIEIFGDGVARLMYLIVSIAARKDGLLMIDEIERGFHYSTFDKLWEVIINAAKVYNCQLILTTHSYEILQSLVETEEKIKSDDISFYRIGYENEVKSYSIDELLLALSYNWEVR